MSTATSRSKVCGLSGNEISSYCRDVEAYLCQKNDGHLIRVAGPSFEVVSGWASAGVPLKVAFKGIDRYCDRYYGKGPRRRPVRIDFCDADVLDVFDEWRRALGLAANRVSESGSLETGGEQPAEPRKGTSLPAHLERVLLRLTNARVQGTLGPAADSLLDRVSSELDAARASARGVRGDARLALIGRLTALDAEVMQVARTALDAAVAADFERQATEELMAFRDQMAPDRWLRARDMAVVRLIRERLMLPTIAFE
jgi:hypothetical protein